MTVLAENRVGAQLGEKVRFEIPDTSFVLMSLLFYAVPLVIGLVILLVFNKLLTMLGVSSADIISGILSLIGFGVGIYLINKKKLFKKDKDAYKVIAYEILSDVEK